MSISNPYKAYVEIRTKDKIRKERMLLQREETMKEDLERFLMQIEDRSVWVTYQLNHVNSERMKKKELVRRLTKKESSKEEQEKLDNMKENGLSFFKGAVKDYKKWQNSGAKHLELLGHDGSISSCKLSKCNQYILSCSEDKTAKLWDLDTSQCMKTYIGHTRIVNDCDIHVDFERYSKKLCFLTCSGDGTLRLWNGIDTNAQVVIKGHTQAVYRCSFSPNGLSMVSCSEDKTIRTWMYPEGYLLYVYHGHVSPVITVRFSPTGRYLISGSDYGERKILVWNARMPEINNAKQFPHVIFWTPEGLIRKILIRQGTPKPSFWLQKNQLSALQDERLLDFWEGEVDDPKLEVFDSESESSGSEGDSSDSEEENEKSSKNRALPIEGESTKSGTSETTDGDGLSSKNGSEKKRKKKKRKKDKNAVVDELTQHDVRKWRGVSLNVLLINSSGDQVQVTEYNPGGHAIVCLQVGETLFCLFVPFLTSVCEDNS